MRLLVPKEREVNAMLTLYIGGPRPVAAKQINKYKYKYKYKCRQPVGLRGRPGYR